MLPGDSTASPSGAPSGAPPARLLVVDDQEGHRKALCEALGFEGYETASFASGKEALDALRPGAFDLLLTDLAMPEMDGIALLSAAQRLDPDLVGIIMTGEGTIASAIDAMKVGALDYILKPFRLSALRPVLLRALSIRSLRRENAELQRRLNEHAEELEAANRELDSFTRSVSHELRNPLAAVLGFAQLVAQSYSTVLPAKGRDYLTRLTLAAKEMDRLIDDLLRFSRVGEQSLTKRTVDVAALVQEVLSELRSAHAGRDVEIRVGALPDAHADRALLKQVFTNLLSNAFKFTRKKEHGVVEVSGGAEAGHQVYVVRDNGTGFDPQTADRLFGVFQRLHGAEEFEGIGIGLSLARRIVLRHGGRISATAEVDRGAIFQFGLPG
ncbi:MAG: response regulator [Acidobacteriota bacterium]